MNRRRTILELRWPQTSEFTSVAKVWRKDASTLLLELVWQAYDVFWAQVVSKIDTSEADDDLERSITQLFEPKIREVMTGREPFYVQHGPYEEETRQAMPAQPPQYDIAFILYSNPRIMWPIEAKVLRTHGAVAKYVKDIQDQFLTCRYAPFSSEGGMLGYLFSGHPAVAFNNIAEKVPCKLNTHPDFEQRDHRVSYHERTIPPGKKYSGDFSCHHMILRITQDRKKTEGDGL